MAACSFAGSDVGTRTDELRELDTEEAAFLRTINAYRATMGAGPLTATRLLNQVAYDHSLDMGTRSFFAHASPEGLSPFDRMMRAGYRGGYMAENIAAGNATSAATFEQWRTSPGHNTNMLNPRYTAIGIGRAYVATSTYRWYWTTNFGDVVDSSAITGTTMPPPDSGVNDAAVAPPPDSGVIPRDVVVQSPPDVVQPRDVVASRDSGAAPPVDSGARDPDDEDSGTGGVRSDAGVGTPRRDARASDGSRNVTIDTGGCRVARPGRDGPRGSIAWMVVVGGLVLCGRRPTRRSRDRTRTARGAGAPGRVPACA